MAANESYSPLMPERFPAKWRPVRIKKTRQIKNLEPRSDSIGTERLCGAYWLLLPVLLFLGAAAAFAESLGASLRTVPQGSEEALASGIFLKDSL